MLSIRNFTKTYKGGKRAVDNLNLEIQPGDIYGFIGQNGAGKTTTIKAVAGILDFEEGEIFIDNKSIKKEPVTCKQQLAYIPDNPDIYDYMTGIKYLNFICDMYGVAGKNREADIKKYADMFEITKNLGDLISSYSHGMKQKLVLISAFIHHPKLLILDEPFVGLDPKASLILKQLMHEKCAEGGAIFFSTHVLEVAQKLCNKIAIIKQGRLIVSGGIDDILGNHSLEDVFMEVSGHEE